MTIAIINDDAIELLGRRHDDAKINDLLTALGVTWGDMKISDKDIMNRNKEFHEFGLSINFEDIGQLKEIEFHDIGDGPYILEEITFWGYNDSFTTHPSFPLKENSFESSIEEIIAKLGPPSKRPEDPTRPVQWQRDGYKIVIHWMDGPRKIRNVTYWLTDLDVKSKTLK